MIVQHVIQLHVLGTAKLAIPTLLQFHTECKANEAALKTSE